MKQTKTVCRFHENLKCSPIRSLHFLRPRNHQLTRAERASESSDTTTIHRSIIAIAIAIASLHHHHRIIMDDTTGGHIEACAYACYDQSRLVHYSGSPESAFTVQDFTCTDGRVAKWIQGRSLVSTKTSLVCNQLFHADDVIKYSRIKQGAFCNLTWLAMASDQLTVGSLHSKAARTFVGRSVLVLSNEQAQSFLHLLGRPDQAAELHAAMPVRAPKKVVRWKSCVSSVIPSTSKGRGGDEAFHRSPLAVTRSIYSNLNIIPAVTMDTKNKSSF
jgi:hypothetical protein